MYKITYSRYGDVREIIATNVETLNNGDVLCSLINKAKVWIAIEELMDIEEV